MASEKQRLKEIVRLLAERLAVAVVYIQAIDDSVDPFADPDVDRAWLLATLTSRAKAGIFRGCKRHEPWAMDCARVIESAQKATELSILDTEIFQECLTAIRKMVRDLNE